MTDIEALKRDSDFLRGTLQAELGSSDPGFSADAQHLLKPHGLYQQKDRDLRGQNPLPALMVRGRIPGGRLSPEAWLAWDGLADRFGDGSLRLTTRQSLELHRILKGDVKATLQSLKEALQTSQGACGDVVRNVLSPPNPTGREDLAELAQVAEQLSNRYLAKTRAYAEIFLDGEPVDQPEEEPLYGSAYLPRKFKIALTVAGENAVDLFTHDLGLAATFEAGAISGWHLFAGGGMGMTHGQDATFPRLADHLGWLPDHSLHAVADAVLTTYRDHGHRGNRRRARLKYLLHDRGAAWFRQEVETRSGLRLEDRPLPPWSTPGSLGWHRAADGTWSLGLHTLSGRISGERKALLRVAVAAFSLPVQLTPEQDLILLGIPYSARRDLEDLLGALLDPPQAATARALACVALPWCGLAVAEAERALPEFLALLQPALERHAPHRSPPTFRVTGCANGCARPYAAELALVGQAPGRYVLWGGGSPEGTRLALPLAEKVTADQLPHLLDALLSAWAAEGREDEALGDFVNRAHPALQAPAFAKPSQGPRT